MKCCAIEAVISCVLCVRVIHLPCILRLRAVGEMPDPGRISGSLFFARGTGKVLHPRFPVSILTRRAGTTIYCVPQMASSLLASPGHEANASAAPLRVRAEEKYYRTS